jgi:hypothetical protein
MESQLHGTIIDTKDPFEDTDFKVWFTVFADCYAIWVTALFLLAVAPNS